jgi:GNAT superfamily N-acetyltransferase
VIVFERFRRRGLGAALTRACCERAARLGCTDVTLNATAMGEPLYRSLGFASLGLGRTWWRHGGC